MNRAMILPAAIAAGLHIAVLGFKSSPPAPAGLPEKPEPIDWAKILLVPVEEEVPVVGEEQTNIDSVQTPAPIAPRSPEYIPKKLTNLTGPTIKVDPSDSVRGDSTTLIPPGIEGGFRISEGAIDSIFLDNVPRALFRSSPNRPRGTGSDKETVTVDFIVGKDGTVAQVRVIDSSNSLLEDACLRAVKRWRFEPGMRKNLPVAFRMQQTFVFTTDD